MQLAREEPIIPKRFMKRLSLVACTTTLDCLEHKYKSKRPFSSRKRLFASQAQLDRGALTHESRSQPHLISCLTKHIVI